jgi:hypothetical protein
MNTHTYEIVDGMSSLFIATDQLICRSAALRHPHIQVDVWGPGWAGYNASLPISVNVNRRAYRIAQLEASRAEFMSRQADRTRARESAGEWMGRATGRNGRVQETEAGETVGEEVWERPAWVKDGHDEDCGVLKWDIVWTIS